MVPMEMQQRVWLAYRQGQERDKRPSTQYLIVSTEAEIAVAKIEGREIPPYLIKVLQIWKSKEVE